MLEFETLDEAEEEEYTDARTEWSETESVFLLLGICFISFHRRRRTVAVLNERDDGRVVCECSGFTGERIKKCVGRYASTDGDKGYQTKC